MKKISIWWIISGGIILVGVILLGIIWYNLLNSGKEASPQPIATVEQTNDTEKTMEAEVQTNLTLLDKGKLYVQQFLKKDFNPMLKDYPMTATMKKAMNKLLLETAYLQVTMTGGDKKEILKAWEEKVDGATLVSVAYDYEKTDLVFIVAFDPDGLLSGFHFNLYVEDKPTIVPSDGNVKEVIIGEQYPLKGELIAFLDEPSSPVIIMVQGSGPSDKNETIYTNQPFKDIAEGLAAKGIGSYRFDKRTYTYGAKLSSTLTLDDEIFQDVDYAIKKVVEEVGDTHPIYVLGHSLGAYVNPVIMERHPELKGIIMMAPPGKRLEDKILEQTDYLLNIDGKLTSSEKQTLSDTTKQVENIKTLTDESNLTPEVLLNVDKSYWLSLKSIEPLEVVKNLTKPILILQGENDYQVTMEDFALWKKAVTNQSNVTMIHFSELNHLFMIGEKPSTPEQYQIPGHVSQTVIDSIVDWIKEQ